MTLCSVSNKHGEKFVDGRSSGENYSTDKRYDVTR